MPGPRTPSEALLWAQQAMRTGRYFPSVHFRRRLELRHVTMADVRNAIAQAAAAVPHDCPSQHQGTCWRILGEDLEGDPLAVAVEAYLDVATREKVILCTV